jgi:TolB-like protein/DNA-binding winged helix-turn-helix (wHTH) protein
MLLKRQEIYQFESFRLDIGERYLSKNGKRLQLTDKAFDLLTVLVQSSGRLISKDDLLSAVWPDTFVEENNLDKHVSQIRRTLGDRKGNPKYIETVRGRGYRFLARVAQPDPDEESKLHMLVREPLLPRSPRTSFSTRSGEKQSIRSNTIVALADWKSEPQPFTEKPKPDAETPLPEEETLSTPKSTWKYLAAALTVAVLAIIGVVGWRWSAPAAGAAPIESVAVLPFANDSGSGDLDYLSDGLSEALIDKLAQISKLKVIARTSSFNFRGSEVSPGIAAEKLGAQVIVTGRVAQRGDNLLIRIEMIDTRNNRQLWSEQFDRRSSNIIAVKDEIARTAFEKLRLKLTGVEERRLNKSYTHDPAAYNAYLQGHFLQYKYTPEDLFKSIEFYKQATELDPNFALAYVGLSESTGRLGSFRDIPKQDYRQLARGYVEKALALDDQLPEAHASLGSFLSMSDYDFVGAEREYQRALELNPNYSEGHIWRGQLLSSLGKHDEALAEIRRGMELDPLSISAGSMYGEALFFSRRFNESIEQLKRVLLLDPNYFPAHRFLAFNYEMIGDYDMRIAETMKVNEIGGTPERAQAIMESYKKGGWHQFLRDAADDKFDLHEYSVATWCAELGENDKALKILNSEFDRRASELVIIKVDPRLDNLRGDPRFQDLLARVGFPKP